MAGEESPSRSPVPSELVAVAEPASIAAAGASDSPAPTTARLRLGMCEVVLERTETGGILRLVAADGAEPLEIEVGPRGPLLRLRAGIGIVVDGPLAVSAQAVALTARDGITMKSGGGIELRAEGDVTSEGRDNTIVARLGDVAIRANDDVRVNGERIKLNC
jgi:hypothetical protein